MKLLVLDTATEACSVALVVDGQRHHDALVAGRDHSRHLPRMVRSLMTAAGLRMTDLDGLVCGIGPGSFAGVRIGVAYAKGLAAGLSLPVVGIPSLAMLAQAAIRSHQASHVLAAIDARMDQVYFAVYENVDGYARRLDAERVCDPAQVAADLPLAARRTVAVGSGWQRYGGVLGEALSPARIELVDGNALPDARDALDLALQIDFTNPSLEAASLMPLYLRNRVALTRAEQAAARLQRG